MNFSCTEASMMKCGAVTLPEPPDVPQNYNNRFVITL
jgi:hypothetical protein